MRVIYCIFLAHNPQLYEKETEKQGAAEFNHIHVLFLSSEALFKLLDSEYNEQCLRVIYCIFLAHNPQLYEKETEKQSAAEFNHIHVLFLSSIALFKLFD